MAAKIEFGPEWWQTCTFEQAEVIYHDLCQFEKDGLWKPEPPDWCRIAAKFFYVATGNAIIFSTAWEVVAHRAMEKLHG